MENIQKALGARFKTIRKSKGLTQEQVADKGEMNPKYYGAIERGKINITLKTVASVARILDIEIKDLFTFSMEIQNTEELQIIAKISQILKTGNKDQKRRLNIFLNEVFK
ncbi:MAG: helix-turn-helix transcriptional regulator [bacterium]|nr:helix-turn-helix transcriptional regulator [bacterium]